ncbi:OLC1v1004953C1 [Oldenlandia corymbosa var. corymbosa]|uniref:OLC1v1004953C1 n=1 Tax=Oldenlandia corymbosa var. corymbosa TaxID=529605 RepID=A0AAV1DDR5_OLDCO|nr:OLC1v1004953C1 [Oldenlandia corymbosa var. corymbosa]
MANHLKSPKMICLRLNPKKELESEEEDGVTSESGSEDAVASKMKSSSEDEDSRSEKESATEDIVSRVGIAGVAADSMVTRTTIIDDNWIPTWDHECKFPLIVSQLALLRSEVHEYDMSKKDDS